jgi:shikimate 5-dehydrogenase/shikimate kinase
MIVLLIGHRGVGKTTFLERIREKFPSWSALDLDSEIERISGTSVSEIFKRGEAEFREWEKKILARIVQSAAGPTVVALGAGFEGPLPKSDRIRALWLRRVTDAKGRVFTDRPRLNPAVAPLDEYMERFPAREKRFREWADEELFLPEGYEGGMEDVLHRSPSWNLAAEITALSGERIERDLERFNAWNIRRIELRDDLLNEAQIEKVLHSTPKDKILFAQRTPQSKPRPGYANDWPLELGPPKEGATIVSRHQRGARLEETLSELDAYKNVHLKLAVEISNFDELWQGHLWWQNDPTRRSFLPRSKNGRWSWYRSLFGPRMPLHFIREGEGSAPDQPYLWQAVLQTKMETRFAAVLGSPVEHSRSPLAHLDFFKAARIPFVAIEVTDVEWPSAIQILRRLGLGFAAVTSPLKQEAFRLCTDLDAAARRLESVNTLVFNKEEIVGRNTDHLALKDLARETEMNGAKVWLWGGGGVRSSVQQAWPQALKISAREGTVQADSPDLLIWAVDRSRRFEWPSSRIKPRLVLDLNYGDDSPGREWAVQNNIGYQSGLKMFKLQAAAQQRFWRDYI